MPDKIDVKLLPKNVGGPKPIINKNLNYELKKLPDGQHVINIQIPIDAIPNSMGSSIEHYRRKSLDVNTKTMEYDLSIVPKLTYLAGPLGTNIEDLSRMVLSLKVDIGGKKPPDNSLDD